MLIEIASLRVYDVQSEDGTIKNKVPLSATQTKSAVRKRRYSKIMCNAQR
jgi:hypothetical protein